MTAPRRPARRTGPRGWNLAQGDLARLRREVDAERTQPRLPLGPHPAGSGRTADELSDDDRRATGRSVRRGRDGSTPAQQGG